MVYSDSSGKAPGGWGFYSPLSAESSLNKNPIPMGLFVHFLVFVGIISKKKRGIPTVECILSISRIGILRFRKSSKLSSKISVNYVCSINEDSEPLVI